MVMEVVTHPTDIDYSQFILALPCRIRQSYSLARTNRNPKPEDNVPDYKGPATRRGSRVEAILFCPDQEIRIMTVGLSSLHLRVRL